MKTGGRYVRHGGRGRARSSTPSRSRRSLVRPLRGSGPPFAQHSHTRSDRADAHARARKCHRPRTQQQWCDIRSLSIAALSCLSLPSPLPHGTRQPLVPSPVARRSPALCRQCAVLVVGSSACFSLLQLACPEHIPSHPRPASAWSEPFSPSLFLSSGENNSDPTRIIRLCTTSCYSSLAATVIAAFQPSYLVRQSCCPTSGGRAPRPPRRVHHAPRERARRQHAGAHSKEPPSQRDTTASIAGWAVPHFASDPRDDAVFDLIVHPRVWRRSKTARPLSARFTLPVAPVNASPHL